MGINWGAAIGAGLLDGLVVGEKRAREEEELELRRQQQQQDFALRQEANARAQEEWGYKKDELERQKEMRQKLTDIAQNYGVKLQEHEASAANARSRLEDRPMPFTTEWGYDKIPTNDEVKEWEGRHQGYVANKHILEGKRMGEVYGVLNEYDPLGAQKHLMDTYKHVSDIAKDYPFLAQKVAAASGITGISDRDWTPKVRDIKEEIANDPNLSMEQKISMMRDMNTAKSPLGALGAAQDAYRFAKTPEEKERAYRDLKEAEKNYASYERIHADAYRIGRAGTGTGSTGKDKYIIEDVYEESEDPYTKVKTRRKTGEKEVWKIERDENGELVRIPIRKVGGGGGTVNDGGAKPKIDTNAYLLGVANLASKAPTDAIRAQLNDPEIQRDAAVVRVLQTELSTRKKGNASAPKPAPAQQPAAQPQPQITSSIAGSSKRAPLPTLPEAIRQATRQLSTGILQPTKEEEENARLFFGR